MMTAATMTNERVLSVDDRKQAVGRYANYRIGKLQYAYTVQSSSVARAHLALLRRGIDDGRVRWMNVGFDLYEDWPQDTLGNPALDNDTNIVTETWAIAAALQMYALHQQSKSQGMAWMPDHKDSGNGAEAKQRARSERFRHSFGHACRMIDADQDGSKVTPVLRRLQIMEDAPDLDGIRHQLYSLIRMMRNQDVELDYQAFAQDLYLLELPGRRASVFHRWARQYYAVHKAMEVKEGVEGQQNL